MGNNIKGISYALIAVLLWATLGLSLKLSVTYLDDFTVALFVGIFTVLAFACYLIYTKRFFRSFDDLRLNWKFFAIMGFIGLGIQQLVYIRAYSFLPASQTVILFYTYPLLIVLIAMLFGNEKVKMFSILCLVTGFIGIYFVVSKGALTLISFSIGTILALSAALFWAIFSYLLKKNKADEISAMFWYSVFGLLFLMGCVPFNKINYTISFVSLLGLIYVAVFPTAIAFLFWGKAINNAPTHICSSIALLTPILSLVLIAIVLKESIIFSQIFGFAMVLGAVGTNIYLSERK